MKKAWKIASVVVVVLVASLAGFFYWATWEGSTKEIVAVADKFQPESSWRQVTNQVVPPRTTCLEANCPSLYREWRTNSGLTKEELLTILHKSGWRFGVKNNCEVDTRTSGVIPVCSAEGVIGDYRVSVTAWRNSEDVGEKIILSIRKK